MSVLAGYDPDQMYSVVDNVEALRLIVDKGFLDLLLPKNGGQFAAHCYETEHHWCCASYHCGHEEQDENGYAVYMLPKSKHTQTEAAMCFADCIIETTTGITTEHRPYGKKEHN